MAIAGRVHVRRREHEPGVIPPGHLIGTTLALTGHPSHVSASFTEPGRYMCWPLSNLRAFVDKRPELRVMLQGLVNRDLAGKLGAVMLR
jgi:hypothetical protein